MDDDDFGQIQQIVPLTYGANVERIDLRERPDVLLDAASQDRVNAHVAELDAAQQAALAESQSLVIS